MLQTEPLASQALRLRALALASWQQRDFPADVAALLVQSRDLYTTAGCPGSAAVSAALAGLLLSEQHQPLAALPHFDDALPELVTPPFLRLLARLGKALCLAKLDRRAEALAILPDPSTCLLAFSDETLAAQWLYARVSALLRIASAPLPLRTLFDGFLDARRYHCALLAALDLCQLGASPSLLRHLRRRLNCSLPPTEPHSTWLRAFKHLASDLEGNVPFEKASAAFPVLISSMHRFLTLDLLVEPPIPPAPPRRSQYGVEINLATESGRTAQKILSRFPEHRDLFESEARRLHNLSHELSPNWPEA